MLIIKSLSYAYQRNRQVLQEISTILKPGHTYGLLGLNGEGKTTLLKCIGGMLLPKKGEIFYGNIQSTSRSAAYYNEVFFLPDTSKLPDMKINQFGEIYGAFYSRYNHSEFINNLESFHLATGNSIKPLSLGQHRKVHIAFALACNTSVLLMDEPSNGLDIPSKNVLRKLLTKSLDENKIFLIATHQIRDIDNLLDHLLILNKGKLILDSNLNDLANEYRITRKPKENEKILYVQNDFEGNLHFVKMETCDEESKLDIEFLFNAFTNSNTSIKL